MAAYIILGKKHGHKIKARLPQSKRLSWGDEARSSTLDARRSTVSNLHVAWGAERTDFGFIVFTSMGAETLGLDRIVLHGGGAAGCP